MVELAEEAKRCRSGPRVGLVDLDAGDDTREDVGDLHTSTTVAYQLQSSQGVRINVGTVRHISVALWSSAQRSAG